MLQDARRLGATVFQICDYPPLEAMDRVDLTALREEAAGNGLRLEIGTRGVDVAHLRRYLSIAQHLDAGLVRSMVATADAVPALDAAAANLIEIMPEFETAGVQLSLETYEQVSCADLVALVARVGSSRLGICLDPANSIAALDLPADVIRLTAPFVTNVHVKDFAFARREGGQGFTVTGTRLGTGQLDYAGMIAAIDPGTRGVNLILEHWMPWQGDEASTVALEEEWTEHGMAFLLEHRPV